MRISSHLSAASLAAALSVCAGHAGLAHEEESVEPGLTIQGDGNAIRADGHAPIGVMGDHMHKAGEWMISYRYMRMHMKDNRDGTDDLSPEDIVTNFSNPNAPPPTFRVVPTRMTTQMHMFGLMYAPADWITLMLMGNYTIKSMDHITFQGAAGTTRLGTFNTGSEGFGDTRATALLRLYEDPVHHLHANLGMSFPTGSIDEEDQVLAPTGARPTLRLPYAMQLGSGTFDAMPGLTYTGALERLAWGAQLSSTIPLGDNDEGWSFGDKYSLTAWGSWLWDDWISTSVRLTGTTQGRIDGRDSDITAPVTTADPDNYGGEKLNLSLGANLVGQEGLLRGHRLAFEVGLPLYQDLNGPQLKSDWMFTIGYQKAF